MALAQSLHDEYEEIITDHLSNTPQITIIQKLWDEFENTIIIDCACKDKRLNINELDGEAICWSTANNTTQISISLLSQSHLNPSVRDNLPLSNAITTSNKRVIDAILTHSQLRTEDNFWPIKRAIVAKKISLIPYLLDYQSINLAKNNYKQVKILIKTSSLDPNHTNIVLQVLADSRVYSSIQEPNNWAVKAAKSANNTDLVAIIQSVSGNSAP